MKKIILLMDNMADFLDVQSRLLEIAGYRVLQASTLQEAKRQLKDNHIHLAIFDIRMQDEDDATDISGLSLAQKEEYRALPKIILTGFPSYEKVRDALSPPTEGLPPAVNFIGKDEGPGVLIAAVEKVFAEHVRINWKLAIQTNERNPITFPYLATLTEPKMKGEQLLNRAEEMEDLFRRLFYSHSSIKIDRLLWQREGRVALAIFAFAEGKAPESLVVVCGKNTTLSSEARSYREFAPKASGHAATVLSGSDQTTHFAANAYALAGADLENVYSLTETYRSSPEKLFNAAVSNLFDKTLADWHQEKLDLEEDKTLEQVYRVRLGLTDQRFSQEAFEERVQFIARRAPTIGAKIEQASGKLQVRFDGLSFSYPDPTPILYNVSGIESPALLMNTPGTISCDNILADASGQIWLTDFADAGPAPQLWNFVSLEAAIRFDLMEKPRLQYLHDLEQHLVADEFSNLYSSDIEQSLRKPLRAIQVIRRLAYRLLGKDALPYHLGILFHAASRLAAFDLSNQVTSKELTRLAHLLIAAAVICDKLTHSRDDDLYLTHNASGIRIDKVDHTVWVEGSRIRIRGHSYALLCYLYDRANQLCTRRELIEQALHERDYDETDVSQINRLNTAIHRLRKLIQDDPEHPRYLLTEQGGGYRLLLQRED